MLIDWKDPENQHPKNTYFKIFKFYKNAYKIYGLKVWNNKGIKTTLFCIKGTKLKHEHTGSIKSYSWEKDDCLQDLQNRQDSEKLNFTELAKKYNLRDQSGINIIAHEIEAEFVSNWEENMLCTKS